MTTKIPTLIKFLLLSLTLLSSLAQAEIKITYYVPDASGSPIAATDEQGKVIWRKHYRPYGAEINPGPDSRHNHIGYTGHVQDASTGLIYMGARYYNPIIGRINGIDPAAVNPADPRTFNRYAYAHNSPYNYVDPDGRNALILWGVGVGLMLADMASNDPVPGHEQDGIASVITMPGPMKLGGKVAEEVVEQGGKVGAKSTGKTVVRTTRGGDKAVRTTRPDGSVIDISPKRVKEFVPNTHPKAPPGALNRVKFDNAIPGSKGFKRPPTQQELDILKNAK